MRYTVHVSYTLPNDRLGHCVTESIECEDKEIARDAVKAIILRDHPDAIIGKSSVRKSVRR